MMKNTCWILFLCFLALSCKNGAETETVAYVISGEAEEAIAGEVWKSLGSELLYDDLRITARYFVFSSSRDSLSGSLLDAYAKNDPDHSVSYRFRNDRVRAHTIDFVQKDSDHGLREDKIWIVENKTFLKQLQCRDDSVSLLHSRKLPYNLNPSACYHFTSEETYGVLLNDDQKSAFYFFRPDSGYYRVFMEGISPEEHKNVPPFAFLSHLGVNESGKAIVCAFRFFNIVRFFDLRGNLVRSVSVGKDSIRPVQTNDRYRSLDYIETRKCFIDLYQTDDFVYCLYDGSTDFSSLSKVVIFKWDGSYVRTLQADRALKNIAVAADNAYFIALAKGREGACEIVKYNLAL